MAYDEELAERIRELVAGEAGVTEQKMFGGLAFLAGGNMAIAASGQGGALVRVDPDESERLVASTNARLFEMRGRSMNGWLRVDDDDLRTKRQLVKWVELGMSYARSLPAKALRRRGGESRPTYPRGRTQGVAVRRSRPKGGPT
jgi:TfoX/Sxy family transcriptional regulator of competence genes